MLAGSVCIAQPVDKKVSKDLRLGGDDNVRVIYIGKGDTDPGVEANFVLGMGVHGALKGDGPLFVTDEMLQKWMTILAKDKKEVAICLDLDDPKKTTIRTVSDCVLRLRKATPKEAKLIVFVRDGD